MADKKIKKFTKEEKQAMKERVRDTDGEQVILDKIKEMSEPDKSMALRLHKLIMENAPTLTPRTWYGMPAYANKDKKVVCFFQGASKFKTRYSTLGFSDSAKLDKGEMWATSYALLELTPKVEEEVIKLVKQAVS